MLYNVPLFLSTQYFVLSLWPHKSALLMFKIAIPLRFMDIINKSWHLLQTFG